MQRLAVWMNQPHVLGKRLAEAGLTDDAIHAATDPDDLIGLKASDIDVTGNGELRTDVHFCRSTWSAATFRRHSMNQHDPLRTEILVDIRCPMPSTGGRYTVYGFMYYDDMRSAAILVITEFVSQGDIPGDCSIVFEHERPVDCWVDEDEEPAVTTALELSLA